MAGIEQNTPVLVGIGAVDQRLEDWREAREPVELMVGAARSALADSGAPRLASQIQQICVPRGLWHYGDPARLVAEAIGAGSATSVLAEVGILQQTPIGQACSMISRGELDVAMVVGGEARFRWLRAQIAGEEATETVQLAEPDLTLKPAAELYLDAEVNCGLGYMPVNYYAIMESAFRAAHGWSIDAHRDRIAALYSRFSEIATDNPHAWRPGPLAPQLIRDPGPKNPMLAFPYTKLHNTSWNVDQAAALLFCSAGRASELGVPRERWLYPLASAECGHMLSVAQRRELHRVPGAKAASDAAFGAAGCTPGELDFVELYSCFPVAVESYARELGLDMDRDLTVTGGMPFAGGPLNNYVLQATCRLAELMRRQPGSKGVVTSVSGLLTKQGIGLWSAQPPERPFSFIDVTEAVAAANPPLDVVQEYHGDATIAGYTVIYESGSPVRAVAMIDLPDGRRAVAWSDDAPLMDAMQREEYCGRPVRCSGTRFDAARP